MIISTNIGSGNGLVPRGNEPLLERMLTKICDAVCHFATMSAIKGTQRPIIRYLFNTERYWYIDGLVQERRNSRALEMELRLSCTNPFISW